MNSLFFAQSAWETFQKDAAEFMPKLVGCLLVLIVGTFISWVLSKLAHLVSEKLGLQNAAEQSGLAQSMRDVGITRNLPHILGQVIFYVGLVLTVMLGLKKLELNNFDTTITQILNFFPRLIIAMMILIFGLLFGKFLRGLIATGADRIGLNYAQTLANVVYGVYLIVLLHQVSTLIGLELSLLQYLIMIGFGGMMLGVGLAVGLGGKDVIAGILAGYYVRKRFQAGDQVTVGDITGVVREVGPVSTVIDVTTAGSTTQRILPNTKLLHEGVR
jgi:small-conductance mechanosensitive channel